MSLKKDNISNTAYLGDAATKYDSQRFVSPQGLMFDKIEKTCFSELIKLTKSKQNVLEVGCGTGRFTKHFSSKFDNLIASDASPDMLELAKKNCVGFKNVSFQLIQVDNISAADNTYDIVYGIRLLNQLADKNTAQKAVKEMIRVAKNGGYVLVEFVNFDRLLKRSNKGVQLKEREIIRWAEEENSYYISARGACLFSESLLKKIPSIILKIYAYIDKLFSRMLRKKTARIYILFKKQ